MRGLPGKGRQRFSSSSQLEIAKTTSCLIEIEALTADSALQVLVRKLPAKDRCDFRREAPL